MKVTKIIRTYSRTFEYKKPDGTSLYLKHSAEYEAEPEEPVNYDSVKLTSQTAINQAMSDVGETIQAEITMLDSIFKKEDEPFSGKSGSVMAMPRI